MKAVNDFIFGPLHEGYFKGCAMCHKIKMSPLYCLPSVMDWREASCPQFLYRFRPSLELSLQMRKRKAIKT